MNGQQRSILTSTGEPARRLVLAWWVAGLWAAVGWVAVGWVAVGCNAYVRVGQVEHTVGLEAYDRLLSIQEQIAAQPEGEPRCERAARALDEVHASRPGKVDPHRAWEADPEAEDHAKLTELVAAQTAETCGPVVASLEAETAAILAEAASIRQTLEPVHRALERALAPLAAWDARGAAGDVEALPEAQIPDPGRTLARVRSRRAAAERYRTALATRLSAEQAALERAQAALARARAEAEGALTECRARAAELERERASRAEACAAALEAHSAGRSKSFLDHFAEATPSAPEEFFKGWFATAKSAKDEFERHAQETAQRAFRAEAVTKTWATAIQVPVPDYDFKRKSYRLRLPVMVDTITRGDEIWTPGLPRVVGDRYSGASWLYVEGYSDELGPLVTRRPLPARLRDLAHLRDLSEGPIEIVIEDTADAAAVRTAGGLLLVSVWQPRRERSFLIYSKYSRRHQIRVPYIEARIIAQQLHHPVTLEVLWSSTKEAAPWSGPDYCPAPPSPDERGLTGFLVRPERNRYRWETSELFDEPPERINTTLEVAPNPLVRSDDLPEAPDCDLIEARLERLRETP